MNHGEEVTELGAKVLHYLLRDKPIPLSDVLRYNHALVKDRD